jgi:hypothetical protein
MNSYILLAALQRYLDQRKVLVDRLDLGSAVAVMTDWYRDVPIGEIEPASTLDALVCRYGGWSEGCATGFKISMLRRVTEVRSTGVRTEWFAGMTLMFDPSRYAEMEAFSTSSMDWPSLEEFLGAVHTSTGYKLSEGVAPMSVMTESGGFR